MPSHTAYSIDGSSTRVASPQTHTHQVTSQCAIAFARAKSRNDLILADFSLVVGWSIRQTAKFNSPPNFPSVLYIHVQKACAWSLCYFFFSCTCTCMIVPKFSGLRFCLNFICSVAVASLVTALLLYHHQHHHGYYLDESYEEGAFLS